MKYILNIYYTYSGTQTTTIYNSKKELNNYLKQLEKFYFLELDEYKTTDNFNLYVEAMEK